MRSARVWAAEKGFESGGRKYVAGSFIIPAEGNGSGLKDQLDSAAKDLGLTIRAADAEPSAPRHELAVPRIAIIHTWTNTQPDGWFRLALDEMKVPYDYISAQEVRAMPNLREKYDVIILPPVVRDISALIDGIPKVTLPDGTDFGGPIPWEKTALTPNIGIIDHTPDMRGGMGLEGVANLKKFIEDGGLFIPISSSTVVPIDLGITSGVSIEHTRALQAQGAIFNATVEDKGSPITYGYDDGMAIYFSEAPVFRVSVVPSGGFFGGEGGASEGRPSGRGSLTDPDIPQGRVWNPPTPQPHRTRAEQETYIPPEIREALAGRIPPSDAWPRVVVRFADEHNLWVSGMLAGGNELAEAPAVVDVPVGRGHVVLFANNPMWRQETEGSFMLVMNAAMNYDHLGVQRKALAPSKESPSSNAAN